MAYSDEMMSSKSMSSARPMDAEVYGINAEFDLSHWWFLGRNRIVLSLLRRYLRELSSRTLLDYGCGTGGVSLFLSSHFKSVTGVEPSPEGAAKCRQRGLTVVKSASELEQCSFDAIICLDVLEHVKDDVSMLKELAACLNPGGIALVTVPAYDWLWGAEDMISDHLRRYNRPTLRSAIERAGLELRYLSGFNSFLLPIQAACIVFDRNTRPRQVMLKQVTNLKRSSRFEQSFCQAVLGLEAKLLSRVSFPFGASLVAVVQKHAETRL